MPETIPAAVTAAETIDVAALRKRLHRELFEVVLPFWDRYGIDHERGGFYHTLDHDGRLISADKFHWFQGRGLWIYSFLYNQFGRDPRYLEVAARTREFMLAHFPQADGWWATKVSREGAMVEPFRGDLYGMYFAAEGLQEYAWAAGDERALEEARGLLRTLWAHIERPGAGVRQQGTWMVLLLITTQMRRRWDFPEIAEMNDRALDAIVNRHYHPDLGLNNEELNADFSRTAEGASLCNPGHSIECYWMAAHEALRRGDRELWHLSAARLRRHMDAGWDHVHGGLVMGINVDHPEYEWPVDRPVGTGMEFRERGEYKYVKSFWSLNEVQVAALHVWARTGAEWAARYYNMAQRVIDTKFSLRDRGYPLYLLFTNRRFGFEANTWRQDNYHLPRALALNLLELSGWPPAESEQNRGV
jgi:mannose/cellobiose epimerase-like protein (N-acyl-D-glucosamine 2-epimerase family)